MIKGSIYRLELAFYIVDPCILWLLIQHLMTMCQRIFLHCFHEPGKLCTQPWRNTCIVLDPLHQVRKILAKCCR